MKDLISKKTERVTKRLDNFTVTPETTLKEYNTVRSSKQNRKKSGHNSPTLDEQQEIG